MRICLENAQTLGPSVLRISQRSALVAGVPMTGIRRMRWDAGEGQESLAAVAVPYGEVLEKYRG